MHDATRIIQTDGIVSDGKRIFRAVTQQLGFDWWVIVHTLWTAFCGGDYEGRISLPRALKQMAVHHEAVVVAKENGQWNGQFIKSGCLYVPIPGRRLCIQFPGKACSFGDKACGLYVNRGTSRWPGYATVDNFEDSQYLILIPDELADYGFLVEPLAICQHTIRTALEFRLLNQEPVAVVGLGVLGLLTATEMVDMGIEVVGYDIYATGPRREAFDMLGPMATFVASEPKSLKMNAGRYPLVIEIAGGQRSLVDALSLVEMGGTILAVGIPMCDDVLSAHKDIVVKGATVKGIVSADRLDYMQAVNALRLWFHTRPEFLNKVVTHRIRYEDFEKALAIDPKDRIKVALAFN